MSQVREYQASDWLAVWPMLHAMFLAGDTYTFSPQSTEEEIDKVWIEVPAKTFVACDSDGQILGTYFIKPNQPGLGVQLRLRRGGTRSGSGDRLADVRALASEGHCPGLQGDAVQFCRFQQCAPNAPLGETGIFSCGSAPGGFSPPTAGVHRRTRHV